MIVVPNNNRYCGSGWGSAWGVVVEENDAVKTIATGYGHGSGYGGFGECVSCGLGDGGGTGRQNGTSYGFSLGGHAHQDLEGEPKTIVLVG